METLPSGLSVPAGTQQSATEQPPELRWALTYVTAQELVGETVSEAQIVNALGSLSAQDCVGMIGALSARLHAAPRSTDFDLQRELVASIAEGTDLASMVERALVNTEHPRVAIFEQQLVHLARLAILHADLRPADGFSNGGRDQFLIALFGVTDLLDADLRIEDEGERLSWAVRQGGLNHGAESLTLWSLYYDVLVRLWSGVPAALSFEVEEAFRRYTGTTLRDHFTFAFGGLGRFAGFANDPATGLMIEPRHWFSSTKIEEAEWRPYFDRVSRSIEDLREAVIAEEARYGPTTYGCQVFDETPLLDLGDDRYVPINMSAFERSATEGIFFTLADGAQSEGRPRETFTSPFGGVFEESVARTFERLTPSGGAGQRVHRDFLYGPKRQRVRSSDIILDYGSELVFVEAVAGQLRVATRTRGDLRSLRQDLRKLVHEKAGQLDRCIGDLRIGRLEIPDFAGEREAMVWPVIVTSVSIPYTPPVAEAISAQLRRDALLHGRAIGPLSLISAEELAAAEGLIEKGASFLELIRGWHNQPGADLNSFKNYLIGTASGVGAAPPGSYQVAVFQEAADEIYGRLFDRPPPAPFDSSTS
jgi:hypothetical protein